MARRIVRAALRQGQRRATTWVASADMTAVANLAAATSVLHQSISGASLLAAGLVPGTIVRVRGSLYTKADTIAAAEQPFGAMAMLIVGEAARAAGIASINQPIADEASEQFFVYEQWFGGGITDTAGFKAPWYIQNFDSKAMRKIQEGDAIAVVLENASASHGMQFIIKFRLLVKLH